MHILELEMLTNDLYKTEKFYRDILGLRVAGKSGSRMSFLAGNTTLIFRHTSSHQPLYHIAFNIPNNKLDEALDWMRARVEILDATPGHKIADFVNWNAKSFYFYDSCGNILELIVRFDLDNNSTTPFNGSSIICVSEIGIAIDDVSLECDALVTNYNMPVFSKQPRLPNFTVLGDHHGLIILSSVNRHWHPTDRPAQKCHTKIAINNNNQIHSLSFYTN